MKENTIKTKKAAAGLMTEGSITKKMLFFALPLFLGNLFQQLYYTVDALIVGNFLGSSALAAVSSSGMIIYVLLGLFSGISTGAGVIVAQAFGGGNQDKLEKAVHTAFVFALGAGLFMTVFGVCMTKNFLIWMHTPESVMPEARTYLTIYFMGSLGQVLYSVLIGMLQAVGDSRHPLYYLIISSVINLVLDVLLITVFHWGVAGAALATIFSQMVSALMCLFHLLRIRENYRLEWKKVRVDRYTFNQIIKIGLPSGIQYSILSFANAMIQSFVNGFGEMAMAGYGVYAIVEGFVFMPITSFTMALSTFVGQNLGAHQLDRVKKGARLGVVSTVVLAEIIGVLVFIFAPVLTAAFNDKPEVIACGVQEARIAALFYCMLAFSHAVSAVLRGAGKTMVPMVFMLIIWCALRVLILSVALPVSHNIAWIYWVYPITWTISAAAFAVYARGRAALPPAPPPEG